jgi:hypothetical protein
MLPIRIHKDDYIAFSLACAGFYGCAISQASGMPNDCHGKLLAEFKRIVRGPVVDNQYFVKIVDRSQFRQQRP